MLYHLANQDEIEINLTRGRVVVDICSIGGTPALMAPRLRQKKSWVSYLPPLSGCWVTCKTPLEYAKVEGAGGEENFLAGGAGGIGGAGRRGDE